MLSSYGYTVLTFIEQVVSHRLTRLKQLWHSSDYEGTICSILYYSVHVVSVLLNRVTGLCAVLC